jgi:V8-like Glu-specific endopeptidase
MLSISRMKFSIASLTALLSLLLSVGTASGASDIDAALQKRGSPHSLEFVKKLKLSPELSKVIARDISTLPPDDALRRITDRLRLELVGTGVLNYPGPSHNATDTEPIESASTAATHIEGNEGNAQTTSDAANGKSGSRSLLSFRNSAREQNFVDSDSELRDAFPAKQVLASAYAVFKPGLEQTFPGIAIDPQPVNPKNRAPVESSSPSAAFDTGPVATQTIPGTPETALLQCNTPFDKLSNFNCVKNGQRCETFSRWQFGEVVEIITPTGNKCSGTLINDLWILSAAHCFIPDQSAKAFSSKAAFRRDSSGNAVVQLGDLQSTAVYARYADPKATDTLKRVQKVIVNPNWDPKKVIQNGAVINVEGQAIHADWVYPDDLSLVKLVDADAVKTVTPATLPQKSYVGVITTAGYGVTTVGNGNAGDLWVTWPAPPVTSANTELELDESGTTNISTFCYGDSGGPAFEGRNRGCPAADGEARPRVLIGVTSHYFGQSATPSDTAIQDADFCMSAPVSRFMNMATPAYKQWVCSVTGYSAQGCT